MEKAKNGEIERLQNKILLHDIPRDSDGNVIQDDFQKSLWDGMRAILFSGNRRSEENSRHHKMLFIAVFGIGLIAIYNLTGWEATATTGVVGFLAKITGLLKL